MAKTKSSSSVSVKKIRKKVTRPGVHSKTQSSKIKTSKNYKKPYKGQGR